MHSLPLAVSVFWSHIFTMKKSPSQNYIISIVLVLHYSIFLYFYIYRPMVINWCWIHKPYLVFVVDRQPLWKIMDWVRQLGPGDIPNWMEESFKIPWFQVTTHQIPWLSPQTADLKICSWMTIWPSPTNLRTDGVSPCDIFLSKHRWNLSFIMIQMFKKIEKWWSWTWLIVIKIIYDKSE